MLLGLKTKELASVGSLDEALESEVDCAVTVTPSQQAIYEHPTVTALSSSEDAALAGGGFPGALPHWWLRGEHTRESIPPIRLSVLHRPMVFGGNITDRLPNGRHSHGQLVLTTDGGLVPASYGIMDGAPSLPSNLIEGDDELRLRVEGSPVELPGSYYLIGNAHQHFGHFILEGLTRLWAVEAIERAVGEGLKFLVYEDHFWTFAQSMLTLCGISPDRIVHAPRFAICERLFVADPAMRTHVWITEFQSVPWTKIRNAVLDLAGRAASENMHPADLGLSPLPSRLPPLASPHAPLTRKRIYLSRKCAGARRLLNEEAVESIHREFGYEVVFPETVVVEEQLSYVADAGSLAGCVGSQMYLAAFQRPSGRNLIIAPQNFFLKDDMLIANIMGHQLTVVFGSILDFTTNSGWTCDLDILRAALRALHG